MHGEEVEVEEEKEMARNKVKLAWITNDAARRATYKKRRKGVMKKTSELGILCGADTCVIVYGPYQPQPEIWPSNAEDVARILNRFDSMPEIEKSKKMMNQEGYLRERISKVNDQKKKIQGQRHDLELSALLFDYLRGARDFSDLVSVNLVSNLIWLAENKIRAAGDHLQKLRDQNPPPPPAQPSLQSLLLHDHHQYYYPLPPPADHHHFHFQQSLLQIQQPTAALLPPPPPPAADPIAPAADDDEEDDDDLAAIDHDEANNSSGNSSGQGEGDLLVYPPHMLSAPEDLGHAYVHRPKPKDH